MSGQPWNENEDAIIRAHVRAKLSADDAAAAIRDALDREATRDMVTGRARRMGLSFACSPERHRRKVSEGVTASWASGRRKARKDCCRGVETCRPCR